MKRTIPARYEQSKPSTPPRGSQVRSIPHLQPPGQPQPDSLAAIPEAASPPIVQDALRSPGQALDPATRAVMEPHFGHDFSQVRVHTDSEAADSARAVNARAYTVGRNVVFGAGQYSRGSREGQKLIAHELAHVVQQGFTPQALQRQPKKPQNKATTNSKKVYEQIKKRNPELAELITPASIDFKSPKGPSRYQSRADAKRRNPYMEGKSLGVARVCWITDCPRK